LPAVGDVGNVTVALVPAVSEQPAPRLMLTDCSPGTVVTVYAIPAHVPVNGGTVIDGLPNRSNSEGNVTVIEPSLGTAVVAVNATVQVVPVSPAMCELPENNTPDTVEAAAGSASRVAPRPPPSKPSTSAIGRNLVNQRERSCCRAVLLCTEFAALDIIFPPLVQPTWADSNIIHGSA